MSSYTLESSILIWLKYCGAEHRYVNSWLLSSSLNTTQSKSQKEEEPPVHRPQQVSPPTSASQSQGWGFPVWLELKFTQRWRSERSQHEKSFIRQWQGWVLSVKWITSFILGQFFTACSSGAVSNSVDYDRRSKGFTWVLCRHHRGA